MARKKGVERWLLLRDRDLWPDYVDGRLLLVSGIDTIIIFPSNYGRAPKGRTYDLATRDATASREAWLQGVDREVIRWLEGK